MFPPAAIITVEMDKSQKCIVLIAKVGLLLLK